MARIQQLLQRVENRYSGVFLENTKNGYNLGAAVRAAGAFDAKWVGVSGERWATKGDWRNMDAEGTHLQLPVFLNIQPMLPEGTEGVAVEISDDATNLVDFVHPPRAVYFFGPEDGAISPLIRTKCKHTIFIPTVKSLNLGMAVNIVLYDRQAKDAKDALIARNSEKLKCPNCGHDHLSAPDKGQALTHCNACGHDF